jgi:hypothetical protein
MHPFLAFLAKTSLCPRGTWHRFRCPYQVCPGSSYARLYPSH